MPPWEEMLNDYSLELVENFDPNDTCHICLLPLSDPVMTACRHITCWDCMERWLSQHDSCPNCRTNVRQSAIPVIYVPMPAPSAEQNRSDGSSSGEGHSSTSDPPQARDPAFHHMRRDVTPEPRYNKLYSGSSIEPLSGFTVKTQDMILEMLMYVEAWNRMSSAPVVPEYISLANDVVRNWTGVLQERKNSRSSSGSIRRDGG